MVSHPGNHTYQLGPSGEFVSNHLRAGHSDPGYIRHHYYLDEPGPLQKEVRLLAVLAAAPVQFETMIPYSFGRDREP